MRSVLPSKWMEDPPFQRRAEVLSVIAVNCGFFFFSSPFSSSSSFFCLQLSSSSLFSCFLAEIYTRQWMSGSPHFGVGTYLRSLLKGVVCLSNRWVCQWGSEQAGTWGKFGMSAPSIVEAQCGNGCRFSAVLCPCSESSCAVRGPIQLSLKHVVCLVVCWVMLDGPCMLQSLISLNYFVSLLSCCQCAVWSLASSQHGAECCAVGSETVFGKFIRKSFCMFSVSVIRNWACSLALAPRQRIILS